MNLWAIIAVVLTMNCCQQDWEPPVATAESRHAKVLCASHNNVRVLGHTYVVCNDGTLFYTHRPVWSHIDGD